MDSIYELLQERRRKKIILEAEKRVFRKWGIKKTTMENISNEAGKRKSTLYYYYKSKGDIIREVTIGELSSIILKANPPTDQLIPIKVILKNYVVTMLSEIKQTICVFPLVRGEIKGNKRVLEKIRNEIDVREELVVLEILKSGLSTGDFKFLNENNLNKTADAIVRIIRSLELYTFLDNEIIDFSARMIVDGI